MAYDPSRASPVVKEPKAQSDITLDALLDEFEVSDPAVRERVLRLAGVESSGNLNATGPRVNGGMHNGTRARGALQIMPATAKAYPQYDLNDPADATRAGLHYFLDNLNQFGGDLDAATIAHHAGPGTAKKWLREGRAGTVDRATGLSTDDYLLKVTGGKRAKPADKWWESDPVAPAEAAGNWWESDPVEPAEEPGLLERGWSALKDTFSAPSGEPVGVRPHPGEKAPAAAKPDSVMADYQGEQSARQTPANAQARAFVQQQYDAHPEKREAMLSRPDWLGDIARQIDAEYQAMNPAESLKPFDQRREAKLERNRAQGMDPATAEMTTASQMIGGEAPVGSAKVSDFDFDLKQRYEGANPALRGAVKGYEGYKQGVLGFLQAGADLVGADFASGQFRQGARKAAGQAAAIGEGEAGARLFEGAVASLTQQLPLLIGGSIAGGQALILSGMAAQAFGQEYSEGRQAGLDGQDAATRASLFAAFEVIGEKFGLGNQLAALKMAYKGVPTKQLVAELGAALAKEIPGEVLTTTGQFLTDKAPQIGLNPEAGMAQYLSQVADTIGQTIIQGGLMMGGASAVSRGARAMQRPEPDLTADLQFDPRVNDALARQALDPSNAQEAANVAPPLDAASYQGPGADPAGGAGNTPSGPVDLGRVDQPAGAPARSGEPGVSVGEAERQQVAGVVEQKIAEKEAGAAATGDPIELLVTRAEGAALRRAVTPQPANGIDIDQDALLADVEAMFTDGGNLMVQGDNAREAVKRIDPKALASALPRGDGALLVPKRFAGPVMDALQGAKQRVSVAFGGDGMMQAPDVAQFRATVPTQEEVQDVPKAQSLATQAQEARGQEGEAAADGRVTRDRPMNDGATVTDAQGNQYRVHYQRNDLVVAHPIVNGKPQVSADTTIRFWTNQDVAPSGENDRTDPIYPVAQPTPAPTAPEQSSPAPAQTQSADKPKRQPPARKPDPVTVDRAQRNAEDLRAMAQDAGWAEKGGKLIRDAEGKASRTKWIPRAEWFMAGMEARPDVLAQHIEAAARGEWIPVKSARTIEGMVEWLDAQRGQTTLDEDASMYDFEASFGDVLDVPDAREVAEFFDDAFGDFAEQSEADAMRAMGFTEEEIANAGGQTQAGAGSAETVDARGTAEAGERAGETGAAQEEASQGQQEGLNAQQRDEQRRAQAVQALAPLGWDVSEGRAEKTFEGTKLGSGYNNITKSTLTASVSGGFINLYSGWDRIGSVAIAANMAPDAVAAELDKKAEAWAQGRKAAKEARAKPMLQSNGKPFPSEKLAAESARQRKLDMVPVEVDGGWGLAEKPVRMLNAEGRATDGKPIMPGDTFPTLSGRMTTPYPKQKGEKYASQWLIDNAKSEAESRGDDYNLRMFGAITLLKGGFLTEADKDMMLMYLFEQQPDVVPGILRPLNASAEPLALDTYTNADIAQREAEQTARAEDDAKAEPAPQPARPAAPAASANTIFTEDAAEKARALLRRKLGQLNSGVDPEMLQAGITLAGYHIEKGARSFAAYARAMLGDLGDAVRPYLKSWYMGVKYDPRATGFDGMDSAAVVEAADENADFIGMAQQEQGNGTDERGDSGVEPDRRNAEAQDGVGEEGIRAELGRDAAGRGQGVQGARAGGGARRSGELSGREAAPARERGDLTVYTGATDVPGSATRSDLDRRSADPGLDGAPVEPDAAKAVEDAARGGSRLAETKAAQAEADATPHGNSLEDVRAALPALLPGQQEDVFKAEQRFAKPDGYGMLFTNGTGTGKTWTGLGIVKRFALAGKTNTLIVAPNDKIIEDWQKSGRVLGLDIARLQDTNDAGAGIVITTYANFGDNAALASREWDLVVSDESHYLMQDKDGTPTSYLRALRAITLHPDGVYRRHEMLNGDEIAECNRLAADAKMLRMSDDERQWAQAEKVQDKADALSRKLGEKFRALEADIKARQGATRTRAVFLSATPFAYEKTIDWANGYLFDYNESQPSEAGSFRGYNDGGNRERFFMQHLGYRMRYNKLTQPDAKVDSGLMQRQFNGWLKKKGSLSGRMLDVPFDYDRRFILVDSAIGTRIDAALTWLREEGGRIAEAGGDRRGVDALKSAIDEKFDYLSRRYLLEAIKAAEVIPHVREHLALGRKVVVFHDYKKGGGFNPFVQRRLNEGGDDADAAAARKAYNAALDAFNQQFADLIGSDIAKMPNPIDAFQRAFPDVLLFNGNVPKQQRRANVAKFQDDASGPQVILVQSAAGKEGISLHDTTGKYQRVLFNLGQPTQPTTAIQQEGRIYRTGQQSDAIIRYLNTGTNWEKWAFASTIAQRASAAENLGSGEQARALKDAFIQGFEESDAYRAGMEGEGKGGKERDRLANEAISEYDRAKAYYFGQQKKTSKTKAQEGADYFATPEPVGLKMVEWADIRPGERVLEPSAGHGAIARWMPENAERTAIEPSSTLLPRLAMVFDGKIQDTTFEALNVVNKFDAIVMNPPFGSGGKTAIEHVAKAATHLREKGRIVALIPTGPAADKRFEKWFYETEERPVRPIVQHDFGTGPIAIYRGDTVRSRAAWAPEAIVMRKSESGGLWVKVAGTPGETQITLQSLTGHTNTGPRTETVRPAEGLHLIADIKMPGVTFERAGTRVATRIVVIEKQSDPAVAQNLAERQRDYTGVEDIGELFDRLEDLMLPKRTGVVEADKPKAANPDAVGTVERQGLPIVEHTTAKGKVIRGVIRTDLSKAQAQKIDPYTWKKDGGFFIREQYLKPEGDAPAMSRVSGQETAPAMTRSALVQSISSRFPSLTRAVESALRRGDEGKAGGVVVVERAEDLAGTFASKTGRTMEEAQALMQNSIRAWHGSPHRFDRFSTLNIGTGEGAQAYGYGLYFASNMEVAEYYRKALSGIDARRQKSLGTLDGVEYPALGVTERLALQWLKQWGSAKAAVDAALNSGYTKSEPHVAVLQQIADGKRKAELKTGALYEVSITPAEDTFLLWDKPLSEQSAKVRDALESSGLIVGGKYGEGMGATPMFPGGMTFSGEAIYKRLTEKFFAAQRAVTSAARKQSEQRASEYLASIGVRGIKYLDGQSRDSKGDSFNYVVFDDADVEIVDVQFSQNGDIQGFHDPKSGLTFLVAPNLTAETAPAVLLHEATHAKQREDIDRRALALIEARDKAVKPVRDFLNAVAARMESAGESGNATEAAAYIVEEAVVAGRQAGFSAVDGKLMNWIDLKFGRRVSDIVRDFVAMIRAWMMRAGVGMNPSIDDLVALAKLNVRDMGLGNVEGEGGFSRASQTASEAFKKWFGNSRVVDENGAPLVVYHGTGADIAAFDEGAVGANFGDEAGFYFTNNTRHSEGGNGKVYEDMTSAGAYAKNAEGAPNIMPVYVALQNPKIIEGRSDGGGVLSLIETPTYSAGQALLDALDEGFDGIIVRDTATTFSGQPETVVIASRPEQIKSAVGNNGNFDPTDRRINFSRAGHATVSPPATAAQPAQAAPRAAQAQATPPDETRFQAFQRKAQDKLNRFTVIKEWLAAQGVTLSEQADVYKAEERMHSRFANKAEDFREKTVKPLVEKIQRAGYSMDDVAQYLHAQHAEERNIQVASINKQMPDGGSGMKTADANAILAAAPAELKRLANELRAITERTKQILLDSGIISQDMADAWDAAYQHYVPLKGGPEQGGKGTGKGLKANYKGKRALGHLMREEGEWIVENILADHERALMLAEKNRIGQSLLKMAIEVGRDDLLTVGKPEKRGVLKNNTAYEVLFKGKVIGSFQSLEAARTFRATAPAAMKGASPSEFGIRKVSDPTVAYMASPMLADNEVNVYVKGQAIRVQINDELLARAYGNMGTEALGAILRVGATINGYFSKIYTGYNPEFILTNIVRDFTTGVANVTGEEGAMMALRAAKDYPGSFADLFRYATTGNASQWIRMYREDGGNTGAAYLSDLERLGDEISTEYAAYKGVLANLKAGDVKSAARAAGRKAFDKTLVWVERINQAGENSMRLSIYKAMIESGKSRAEAASLAKNATVNFNRNGEVGRQMNALWLFYNAGVQGTAAIAHANLKGRHKWQARAVSAGILGLGYTMAVALGAGDDEDDYDKLSDYTKARNVVIKTGDGWLKIPVPYGYGFFWNMGRAIADAERKGEWGKAPWHVASSFIEEFTPFGAAFAGDDLTLEQITLGFLPTLAQIPASVGMNRTTMGGPMYPESAFDKYQPDNEKMWRATKGTIPDMIAQALDQGGIEVSPETIKYLTRTFTGGAGQFVTSIGDAAWLTANGASLEVKEQPFVRKFYTETDVREARSAYYAAVAEAEKAVREGKSILKMGDHAAYGAYRVENQEFYALDRMAKARAAAIKARRNYADAIRADKSLSVKEKRDKLKAAEAQEQVIYDRYLEVFKSRTRR